MSNCHRPPYAALGGCLAVFLGVSLALAQDSAPENIPKLAPTIEKGQGVTVEAVPPERKAAEKPSDQKAPAAKPAPTAPVKNKRSAKPSCDARCQETEQREKHDLEAQRSMASSAYDLVILTWWQFGVGVAGITLLFVTLYLTRQANKAATRAAKAAEAAVNVASETGQKQLRAYVSQDEPDWKRLLNPETDKHVGYTLMIMWRNFGATPARRCRTRVAFAIFPNGFTSDFDYPEGDVDKPPKPQTSHMGPNGQLGSHIEFKLDDINKAARGEIDLVVWGWIEYDDVFPGTPRRRTEFSYKVEPRGKPENFQFGLLAIGPHNGADEDCYHKPKT